MSPTEASLRLSLSAPVYRDALIADRAIIADVLEHATLPPALATELRLRLRGLDALIDSTPCGHPLSYAQVDGIWPTNMFPDPTACVTCNAPGCGSPINVPLRKDLVKQVRSGGARDLVMVPNVARRLFESSEHSGEIVG